MVARVTDKILIYLGKYICILSVTLSYFISYLNFENEVCISKQRSVIFGEKKKNTNVFVGMCRSVQFLRRRIQIPKILTFRGNEKLTKVGKHGYYQICKMA